MKKARANRFRRFVALFLIGLLLELYAQPFLAMEKHITSYSDQCCHIEITEPSCCSAAVESVGINHCSVLSENLFSSNDNCSCVIESTSDLNFIVFDGKVNHTNNESSTEIYYNVNDRNYNVTHKKYNQDLTQLANQNILLNASVLII